jgi:hypothetical protein
VLEYIIVYDQKRCVTYIVRSYIDILILYVLGFMCYILTLLYLFQVRMLAYGSEVDWLGLMHVVTLDSCTRILFWGHYTQIFGCQSYLMACY